MNPDDFKNPGDYKRAWQGQRRLSVDAELLKEVQRNEQSFDAMIFWRDFREVGVALVMVPLWLYLGAKNSLPWTWYLTVPVLLWVAGFMLVDRRRHQRQTSESGEPLRRHVGGSLAEVKHQIWLLRNVHWWGLLPMAVAMLAFFGHVAWQERGGGWWTLLFVSMVVIPGVGVLAGIYWLNLYAIRAMLEPRRRELETLLMSFGEETPIAS